MTDVFYESIIVDKTSLDGSWVVDELENADLYLIVDLWHVFECMMASESL